MEKEKESEKLKKRGGGRPKEWKRKR